MAKRRKLLSLVLMAAMTTSMLQSGVKASADTNVSTGAASNTTALAGSSVSVNENKKPKQVNVHIGDDASTDVNFTYTTIEEMPTKVEINKVGDSNKSTFTGTHSVGAGNKFFHGIAVKGLEANTKYEYTVGDGDNTTKGTFKTAPAKGSKDGFKFVYIADPQVSNDNNAKALGANLEAVSKDDNVDFVYIAGDLTDSSANESQWENLFYNKGAFPNGGQDMFSKTSVAIVQGNHDNNTMNRHINAPAEEGNIVYSYDYGPAKFIMLNLEAARSDANARAKQESFVRAKVAEAKAAGQWTIVGFHKSIYTGASHITDSDVVEARKYWSPIFSSLDVDLVLQGHDHVYARGFINGQGEKANVVKTADGKIEDPTNAPLYMVGGHAGGLKWYSRKNYIVSPGDPLTPNYSFLDVNSTNDGSDVKQEQWSTEIEVTNTEIKTKTYTLKYDTNTDTITKQKELVDSIDLVRNVVSADIKGPDSAVADTNQEVTYTASLKDIKNTNAFNMQVEYDKDTMEFVKAESAVAGTIFNDVKNEDGKVSIVVGADKAITSANSTDIAKFTFKLKQSAKAGTTDIKLVKADSAEAVIENGKITGAFDKVPLYNSNKVSTGIYTYSDASDINRDGKITLADLSIALGGYQGTDKKYDIDLDGTVTTKDFIIISSKIAS